MAQVAAILAAAGSGARFREKARFASDTPSLPPLPKTLLPLAGRPMWIYGVTALASCEHVHSIVVVVAHEWIDEVRQACEALGLKKISRVVGGGRRRQDSVYAALRALSDDPPELVAVHDGARPLVSPDLVDRCVQSALTRGSGVAALPVTDTLKRATPEGLVDATVKREHLWAVQTPQVFRYEKLLAAHEAALRDDVDVTDDAALVERLGEPVWLVLGEESNLKVTTPADMELAERLLLGARSHQKGIRVGHGFDAHRMGPGRPCIIAGVTVPHDRGPLGHSDGDVLTHAAMDAILGALALGDIGKHFPDTDPKYAGVSSLDLAARVAEMMRERGYEVGNLDTTLVAQAPKIARYAGEMRQTLARALGCDPSAISIKATTTERMGFTGSGEGIAAHAVVILLPFSDAYRAPSLPNRPTPTYPGQSA